MKQFLLDPAHTLGVLLLGLVMLGSLFFGMTAEIAANEKTIGAVHAAYLNGVLSVLCVVGVGCLVLAAMGRSVLSNVDYPGGGGGPPRGGGDRFVPSPPGGADLSRLPPFPKDVALR